MNRLYQIVLACFVFLMGISTQTQSDDDMLLFIWDDTLMAQSLTDSTLLRGDGLPYPMTGTNVYRFADSPLMDTSEMGFHYGFWSQDATHFTYIMMDGFTYQVNRWYDSLRSSETLIEGRVTQTQGYLAPLGYSDSGNLILLERHTLYHLNELNLWQLEANNLQFLRSIPTPNLKGNTANLGDGTAFVGFDTVGAQGYRLNLTTLEITRFSTSFVLEDPPRSVFEVYPVQVVGIMTAIQFQSWLDAPPQTEPENGFIPFLHWMLPDYARSITCYPDSQRTTMLYGLQCVGLATPRAYIGHEGVDIGGRPLGLSIGTPVYAAAQGIVIDTFTSCTSGDASCGDAYGNYILLEHTIMRDQTIETWYTGYAHLQSVLAEQHQIIEQIGIPIALSGDTGLGGAHLHFEVRSPQQTIASNWLDPFEHDLWIGGNDNPTSAITAMPPPTLFICQTIAGNNIRTGPDTTYEVVTQSTAQTRYSVFQIQNVRVGQVTGDWYHIRWADRTGWIWSGVMPDCTPPE